MKERVAKVIKMMQPAFAGTEVVLQSVKDGIVTVDIYASGCHGGPPKEATLAILKEELLDAIPELKDVVAN